MARALVRCPETHLRYRVRDESAWSDLVADTLLSFEISINNPSCSGEYLRCQLCWGRSHFNSYVFSIGDTLNEYNYRALGHPTLGVLTDRCAKEVATQEGATWIANHQELIDRELPPGSFTIMRWNDWRQHPKFKGNLDELIDLYNDYEDLRRAIYSDILGYARRRNADKTLSDEAVWTLAMHTLEELAVYQLQAEESQTVILYPGSMPAAYRMLQGNPLAPYALAHQNYRYIEIRDK